MPGVANLAIYQGDDYAAVVTVSSDSGAPDLTNYVAEAQIRLGPADLNSQIIVEIATQLNLPNQIDLFIPNDITAQLSGRYVWDLQLKDPTGSITTILAGNVVVTQEVTR